MPPLKEITGIHYTATKSRLQTLDLYLAQSQPSATNLPWIIYIHGGAWRDPAQDSTCILPAIKHLQSSYPEILERMAGIASINYRLSPYPNHPTDPSKEGDQERNVVHPAHVRDVARAINYVYDKRGEYGHGGGPFRWIGVGHSCGATLLLQFVSKVGWQEMEITHASVPGPEALILLEGIYDMPLLLQNHEPPACPPNISQIYQDIVRGAFGSDASTYAPVSPVSGTYRRSTWPEGRVVVVAHSKDDELVEEEQQTVMLNRLKEEKWTEGKVIDGEHPQVLMRNLHGNHDFIWEDGRQIADLTADVVKKLNNT